jgi:hypothetical protein
MGFPNIEAWLCVKYHTCYSLKKSATFHSTKRKGKINGSVKNSRYSECHEISQPVQIFDLVEKNSQVTWGYKREL